MRIGIDIGGTDTKIGLVDVHNKLLDSVCIPTKAERPADEVIRTVAETALLFWIRTGLPWNNVLALESVFPEP